ncbi:hypothetical protein, partial [Collinsella aerofaciens]|uniref:hypothetical protein n=1 Tax=Collinsella aerofaciens TaxID=74426 RepID=UPI0034A45DD0
MKNLTWQNPEQLFVAQELINKVKSKCCGIKVCQENDGAEFILVRPECGKAVCGQDGEVVAFQQGAA